MTAQIESLRRFVLGDPRPRPSPRGESLASNVVVIAGGKGGVGTTSVAALLGLSLARRGRRALVIDGTDGPGGLHLLFGADPALGLADLSDTAVLPEAVLTVVVPGLLIAASAGRSTPPALGVRWSERRSLLRRIAPLHETFDLVLIDAGSRLANIAEACAAGADRLLAVTTAHRLSVASTYALLKAVGAREPTLALEVLVNGEEERVASRVDHGLRAALARFHTGSVRFAGRVPADSTLGGGPEGDCLAQDAPADSPALQGLAALADRVLDDLRPTRPSETGPLWAQVGS